MHTERKLDTPSGWGPLFLAVFLIIASIVVFILAIANESVPALVASIVGLILGLLTLAGLFVINPNEAAIMLLFGAYKGTSKQNGLRWANPFYTKLKVSLKARNLNGDRLKVNDLSGNPIEIA
ncbi:SPFH domain-containing protein, partial [bacterium]